MLQTLEIALPFSGSRESPVCPSGKSNVWMKISMERLWNDKYLDKSLYQYQYHVFHNKPHMD
jgi:hypothetical protein